MKVSLVGPVYPYRGGIAHYTMLLDHALQAHGHLTQVASFRRQYPAWLYPGETDRDPSQQPMQTKAEYLLDPLYPWTWQRAASSIARFAADLIVFQWWTTFWAPPYAYLVWSLKRRQTPVVFVIHNTLPHEQRAWDPWLARQALGRGDAFIAQTEVERSRLITLLPTAPVRICSLPVYRMPGEQKISRAQARRQLNLPADGPVLLFFGIVRPYKGLHHLVEALGLLRQHGKTPTLVIAGEFWEPRHAYTQQIDQLGLVEQIIIADRYIPNEQVEVLFAAADALVAPYVGGTQSAAASLGLGCGLPLIITERVAAGISAGNRRDLLIVPSGDSQALAQAIAEFLDAPPRGLRTPAADDWWQVVQTLEELQAGFTSALWPGQKQQD